MLYLKGYCGQFIGKNPIAIRDKKGREIILRSAEERNVYWMIKKLGTYQQKTAGEK